MNSVQEENRVCEFCLKWVVEVCFYTSCYGSDMAHGFKWCV